MSQGKGIELLLERGRDGRLHWVRAKFNGLDEDTCVNIVNDFIEKARRNAWKVEVGPFIPHERTKVSPGLEKVKPER